MLRPLKPKPRPVLCWKQLAKKAVYNNTVDHMASEDWLSRGQGSPRSVAPSEEEKKIAWCPSLYVFAQ
jgi:hypothetical protein